MSPPRSPSWAVLKRLAERPAVATSASMARMPPQISAHLICSGASCCRAVVSTSVMMEALIIQSSTGSIAHRLNGGAPLVAGPILPNCLQERWPQPSLPVLISDREDNFPLAEQRAIGAP